MLLVASNRAPLAFEEDAGGRVVARRGAGGLVTALAGALQRSGGLWVASAMTEQDREQSARGDLSVAGEEPRFEAGEASEPAGARAAYRVRYLSFDRETFDRYYNGVSNEILWFLHHQLWDVPRWPRFSEETRRSWDAYREINDAFAGALDEAAAGSGPEPVFLIQDYHLSLAPALLRARRPRARVVHFSHVPFAGPSYLSVVPEPMRSEHLAGLLGADVVGFHTVRWAESFLMDCRELPGAGVDLRRRRIRWDGRTVRVGVYPIAIDVEQLEGASSALEVAEAKKLLLGMKGDRRLLIRVDRTDLSKNILRGFLAYEEFLRARSDWRGKVVFLALLNPSRQEVPDYRDYLQDCVRLAERINRDLGADDWRPIELSIEDDLSRVAAAYEIYDALLVNPVFDGMNLVAKEGPTLNRSNGVLILSENAGAHAELGTHALSISPFDVGATAAAIAEALEMDPRERARRARGLTTAIRRNRLDGWVGRQLQDLDRTAGGRR